MGPGGVGSGVGKDTVRAEGACTSKGARPGSGSSTGSSWGAPVRQTRGGASAGSVAAMLGE